MRRDLNIAPHPNPPRERGGSRGSSPVHGGGWEGGMLKNQRKDTYQPRGRSLQLPPSCRFPPLREGNRARVRFPLLSGGTLRRGFSFIRTFVNSGSAIGITCFCELWLRDWYKRRTWRTVHFAVDCATDTVATVAVTEARVHDSTVLAALLSQAPSRDFARRVGRVVGVANGIVKTACATPARGAAGRAGCLGRGDARSVSTGSRTLGSSPSRVCARWRGRRCAQSRCAR